MIRLAPLSIVTLALLAVAATAEESNLPPILQDVRIVQHLNWPVPPQLVFRDESGQDVRIGDYFGKKPVILVLAYYRCPKLCTLVLNGLRESLQSVDGMDIGKQFEVLTVSFDPRETPELAAKKKRAYVEAYGRPGAAEGWHFLTGPQASIERLTDSVGFYYAYDPKTDQYAHASAIMFLTPEGRVSRYLYGVEYLPRDVRLALVEASEHKIGTRIDQALLYCFHYDPDQGKYTANVYRLVRLGGAATVAALSVFGLVMWRYERRKKRRGLARSDEDPPRG